MAAERVIARAPRSIARKLTLAQKNELMDLVEAYAQARAWQHIGEYTLEKSDRIAEAHNALLNFTYGALLDFDFSSGGRP